MRRPRAADFVLMVALLGMLPAGRCRAGEEETRKDFERLAGQFQFFCDDEFLFDRPPSDRVPADMLGGYQKLLDEVTAPRHETAALLTLLKHKDPHVRTLAIAALYAKEDPKVLPYLVDMIADPAMTFPVPERFGPAPFGRDKLLPLQECKVGGLAEGIVETYMEHAGFFYGVKHETEPGFAEYWAARKDRTFCASWFKVQLDRASQCTLPTPPDRVKRIRAVRERIDRLPKLDRAWMLLWIDFTYEWGTDALMSEEDVLAACKVLGPDRLLAMLRRKMPSDDPDLQPRPFNNSPYKMLQRYLLMQADKVLRPEDAPALLDCERDERDYMKHGISQ